MKKLLILPLLAILAACGTGLFMETRISAVSTAEVASFTPGSRVVVNVFRPDGQMDQSVAGQMFRQKVEAALRERGYVVVNLQGVLSGREPNPPPFGVAVVLGGTSSQTVTRTGMMPTYGVTSVDTTVTGSVIGGNFYGRARQTPNYGMTGLTPWTRQEQVHGRRSAMVIGRVTWDAARPGLVAGFSPLYQAEARGDDVCGNQAVAAASTVEGFFKVFPQGGTTTVLGRATFDCN